MKSLRIKSLLAGMALCASVATANAALIWDDGATNFNGQYRGAGTFAVPSFLSSGGSNAITFDLFGANSVDGNNGNPYQDVFTVNLNGTDVFSGSFDMSGGGGNVATLNSLGWVWNTVTNPGGFFSGGVTSVSGLANLLIGSNTFSVKFTQTYGPQSTEDESWALNKLDVTPVPLPAGAPLLLAGLGALAFVRRKRAAR